MKRKSSHYTFYVHLEDVESGDVHVRCIDVSSTSPHTSREIARYLQNKDWDVLEAAYKNRYKVVHACFGELL